MRFNRCLGCMEELNGYPCPKCGFDPAKNSQPNYVLPCGSILAGHYVLGKVLGQGGFGITYIGYDLVLHRKVAIKEYFPSGQVSRITANGTGLQWMSNTQADHLREDGMQSFLREARKMAKIADIPEVVRVQECFRENETAYIVMDFVEGQTLQSVLEKNGKMSWDSAKAIFYPAITAMEKVHQAGMVHRDISPDNLMLTKNGIRILDLGAAKDLDTGNGISSALVVKRGFSPLEQYTRQGGTGSWSDVYAMAATMYYSLTGVIPPMALDRLEEDTIDWPLLRAEHVPGHVITALQNAMKITAKERTQSMGEFLSQLQSGIRCPAKKWKTGIAVGCVAVVCAAAVGVGIWMRGSGKPEETPAQSLPEVSQQTLTAPETTAAAAVTETAQTESLEMPYSVPMSETRTYVAVDGGLDHTVVLYGDGTVEAVGSNAYGQCNVENWRNIIQISTLKNHTVGLKSDGTVVAVGQNGDGQCDVEGWTDIIAVSAGEHHTLGLRSDGTVVAAGSGANGECDVQGWENIVAVGAAYANSVGLRSDGTVLVAGSYASGKLPGWDNIVQISVSDAHFVGLRADGTVRAAGFRNQYGQCDVSEWTDITAVRTGCAFTCGLKSDGTVLVQGIDDVGQHSAEYWTDIEYLATGLEHIVGIKADKTFVATGANDSGQCDVRKLSTPPQTAASLTELEKISDTNSEKGNDILTGVSTSHAGANIFDAIRFWVVNGPGYTNTEFIELNLDRAYTTLTGRVFAGDESDSDTNMTLRFYGDGQLIGQIDNIEKGKDFYPELNVAGVRVLKIECTTDENRYGYCYLQAGVAP